MSNFPEIVCVGINHQTAPLEIREKLWFSNDDVRTFLGYAKNELFTEAVLVSTCNRTELYYIPKNNFVNSKPLWKYLSEYKHANVEFRDEHFYIFKSETVVRHLLDVASGIDSMVLGDVQILGQIKDSFMIAQESGFTGILLNRLFTKALHVGKRTRTETELGEGAVSVSYAAAELASKIFEDLSTKTALLIGAGDTGKLTTRHLLDRNLGNLLLTNRTRERAEELVNKLGGKVIDFSNLASAINHADIIVSSVNISSYLLSANDIKIAMKQRGNKPLIIIDIGVPRNIDPESNKIDNVFYHDIDALSHIIDLNLAHRKLEVPKVQQIVNEEIDEFSQWYKSLEVTPTIQQLRDSVEAIRHLEVEKHRHHFTPEQLEEVELITRRIVNKILHEPTVNLKNGSNGIGGNETQHRLHILRSLFGLDKKVPHE